MREADLEVMLYRPEMREAHFFGAHHLVHHVMENLVLALAMLERAVDLDLVENSELHRSPSVMRLLTMKRVPPAGKDPTRCPGTLRRFGGICIVLAPARVSRGVDDESLAAKISSDPSLHSAPSGASFAERLRFGTTACCY